MDGIIYALITVAAWGTWLAPSQNVPMRNQQIKTFYVALVNLVLATAIAMARGMGGLSWDSMWPPFIGGVIWSLSGLCAFTAARHLGMAKAFGIWAPLNIIVSLICGRVLFGEFANLGPGRLALLVICVGVIIGGVLMILFAKPGDEGRREGRGSAIGLMAALGAGVLWGVYYIPIQMSGVSMWLGAFPMAVGIFAGSSALLILGGESPRLAMPGHYWRVGATGVLWTAGNYGMLLLVDVLGAGKGYTIAQLSVVVNALVGIYVLRDPQPGTRAARLTIGGCVLATVGGIALGILK